MMVLLHYETCGYNLVIHLVFITVQILCWSSIGHSFKFIQGFHQLAGSNNFHKEHVLQWDDLELQFLSRVNGPNLHSNGFHVLNATFPARQVSYVIHLSKTEGLFHPELLGIPPTETNHLQCFYSGYIHQVSNGVYSESGTVSLSTCHHEFGFEGLLLLPKEQYYIRPSTESQHHHHFNNFSQIVKRSTAASKSGKPSVPHKAYKVNSPNSPYVKGNVDEVHKIPPEELLRAYQNQSSDLDMLEDEDPTDEGSDTDNQIDVNSLMETQLLDTEDDCDDSSCKNSLPPLMETLSKGKGKLQKRKKAQKKPTQKKISTSSNKVVEIAVFTDEKLYRIWKSRYPQNTMTKMNQYVLAVISNMNALYQQPSMTEKIGFRLVHLEIETSKPKLLKDYNGHTTKYLTSFCQYAAEKNQYGRLWDHALLLTGFDLSERGDNSTAGIAWFSTMCLNGLSCSVIEGESFGSTFITAHEIGHSLGMDHDGEARNKACDKDSYIMSPTTGGGKLTWSKCSVSNMKDYFNKGYLSNPAPTCITKKSAKASSAIKFKSIKLPGQQFNANEQCNADCKGCTVYTGDSPPYNNMCSALFCQERVGNYMIFRSMHPALEGTTCAKGKICRLGRCQ